MKSRDETRTWDHVSIPGGSMIIYTGGTFDLFHAGHVEFLSHLYQLSGGVNGQVHVGLNTDEFVAQFKGRPPVNSYAERADVLRACKFVHAVHENTGGADSRPAIEAAHPELVAIGSDWHGRDYLAQLGLDWEWLHARSIGVLYWPRCTPISTTIVRERMQ